MQSAREIIQEKGRKAVEAYRRTRDLGVRWASSLTRLMEQLGQEYGERFVIELIQNAHDAHPSGERDGLIHIRLDCSSGPHGIVYVANAGQPFREKNFHALCDVAQSDKPPGAGIGNKGIGFRSVLQVCRAPEIWSAEQPGACAVTFNGFCFRFATDADYCWLNEGDSDLCAAMRREVSPYLLPVPADNSDEAVNAFAHDGMASVIRLPLDNDYARSVAERRIEEIRSSTNPALLFLERIGRLVVEAAGPAGCWNRTELLRRAQVVAQAATAGEAVLERIQLLRRDGNGEEKPLGTYLGVKRQVEPERLQDAIDRSIAAGKLDRRFAEWHEAAFVSVAVRLDGDEPRPVLYAYLPMEAESPLPSHLNAPFVTKVARTSLDETVPLNDCLLQVAAEACAQAVLRLREASCGLNEEERDRVIIDLLSWRGEYLGRLEQAFRALDRDLREEPVVPLEARGPDRAWGSITRAHDWRKDLRVLNAKRLAGCGIAVVRGALRPKQYDRLGTVAHALGGTLTPDAQRVGAWAEIVAEHLARLAFQPDLWEQFYEDLQQHFAWFGWDALQGKRLLIDDDGILRPCGRYRGGPEAAVFFPPAEEQSALARIAIPKSVARSVCFLNRRLQLRTEVREFLQRGHLVLRYDTRELIGHVADVGQQSQDEQVQADILRLVFELYLGAGSKPGMLEGVELQVPTGHGWIPAGEAFFSGEWQGTHGGALERLIRETTGVSAELKSLESRLLRAPTEAPFSDHKSTEWTEFLREVGVRDGLWPEAMKTPDPLRGWNLYPRALGTALGLSGWDLEIWEKANHARASRSQTDYRAQDTFFRLPGQSQYPQFGQQARKLYAELIVHGLGLWEDRHLWVRIDVVSPRRRDPLDWMTPLAVFVREAAWVPVGREFVRVGEAWHFRRKGREEVPHFFPLLASALSEAIDASDVRLERLRKLGGMKVFNEPMDAGMLLLRLAERLEKRQIAEQHVRKFGQAYRRAWAAVAERPGIEPFEDAGARLVVSRGSELAAVPLSDAGEVIYVCDVNDPLSVGLLKGLRRPVLEGAEGKVGIAALDILQKHMGDRARSISSVQVKVLLDGQPAALVVESEPLMKPETRWLEELVRLTLDLHSTAPAEQSERDVQRRLGALRIKWAHTLAVTLDGEAAELPGLERRLILIGDASQPVIAIASETRQMDWDTLEALASVLARVIGRPSLGSALQLSLMRLAHLAGGAPPGTPTDEELARALDCGVEEVRRLRREMRGSLEMVVERLRPLLHCFAGDEAARAIDGGEPASMTKHAIATMLQTWSDRLPLPPEELLRACEDHDLEELRDKLEIDFARFNASLSQLGPPYRPFHYPQEQGEVFDAFKQHNRARILAALRERFQREFLTGTSLAEYVKLRTLDTLSPDPAWLDLCYRPSEDMMRRRVQEWLAAVGADTLPQPMVGLPELEKLRADNRQIVRELTRESVDRVTAWCRKSGAVCPAGWHSPDPCGALVDAMHQAGMLDFAALEHDQILHWMQQNGWWPERMPMTTELGELGLTQEDLKEKSEAEKAREHRERERRSIHFDGKRFGAEDGAALVAAVEQSLSDDFLRAAETFSALEPVPERPGGRRGSGPGGQPQPPATGLTEDQKSLIGLVGEKAALEWLKRKYPGTDENCWKSTNRDRVLGGHEGNDSLGYDFEVFDPKKRRLLFEVKATTGEQTVIELGESETRAAHQHARGNKYRILFIRHVLDAERRQLYVLPNPLSERGRGFYLPRGAGMRYQFRLTED